MGGESFFHLNSAGLYCVFGVFFFVVVAVVSGFFNQKV